MLITCTHSNVVWHFVCPQEAIVLFQKWGLVDGLFLVRLSTRDHGYYVLSVVVNAQIYHYQIRSRVIIST